MVQTVLEGDFGCNALTGRVPAVMERICLEILSKSILLQEPRSCSLTDTLPDTGLQGLDTCVL